MFLQKATEPQMVIIFANCLSEDTRIEPKYTCVKVYWNISSFVLQTESQRRSEGGGVPGTGGLIHLPLLVSEIRGCGVMIPPVSLVWGVAVEEAKKQGMGSACLRDSRDLSPLLRSSHFCMNPEGPLLSDLE